MSSERKNVTLIDSESLKRVLMGNHRKNSDKSKHEHHVYNDHLIRTKKIGNGRDRLLIVKRGKNVKESESNPTAYNAIDQAKSSMKVDGGDILNTEVMSSQTSQPITIVDTPLVTPTQMYRVKGKPPSVTSKRKQATSEAPAAKKRVKKKTVRSFRDILS